MVEEIKRRQLDQFFTIRLDEHEAAYLVDMLDEWANDPEAGIPLFADLRDAVDGEMEINRMEAFAIVGCLEDEGRRGPLYRKFTTVLKNKVLPS